MSYKKLIENVFYTTPEGSNVISVSFNGLANDSDDLLKKMKFFRDLLNEIGVTVISFNDINQTVNIVTDISKYEDIMNIVNTIGLNVLFDGFAKNN